MITDNELRALSLGLMLIIVGLFYLLGIIPAAAQPGIIYGPYGPPGRDAYRQPGCNAYYNPDCGRFGWEGPRARQYRWREHPMMPDAPRHYRPGWLR